MSDTPKKKTSKSTPAKKQAQKKPAQPKGTGKPGRPRKVVEPKPEVTIKEVVADVEQFLDQIERVVDEQVTKVQDNVVVHAESIKKISLRKRMMKWFK